MSTLRQILSKTSLIAISIHNDSIKNSKTILTGGGMLKCATLFHTQGKHKSIGQELKRNASKLLKE